MPEYTGETFKTGSDTIRAFELFTRDEPEQLAQYPAVVYERMGYVTEEIKFPALYNNDGYTIADISPKEINLAKKYIAAANGKVLALGLNLGYFAYMVAGKKRVTSVTVVEQNKELVDFFTQNILPQMDKREKIEVICADPKEFLNNINDGDYNYIYNNITRDETDVYSYLDRKHECNKFVNTQCGYYGEGFHTKKLSAVIHAMYLYDFCQKPTDDLPKEHAYLSEHINKATENVVIATPEDMRHYMRFKTLRELAETI